MYVLFRYVQTGKPYQDTKPRSNDELAAIWLEGKIINTARDNNGEMVIQLMVIYQVLFLMEIYKYHLNVRICFFFYWIWKKKNWPKQATFLNFENSSMNSHKLTTRPCRLYVLHQHRIY